MIKLSDKATGDELTANEWDNHSKELENVVTNAGLSLSANEDDLSKAIDIFAKSQYYETTNIGNDYSIIDRGFNIEELKKGMSIVVKFNTANNGAVTLNLNGSAINVKNSDGTILTDMRFKDGEIIPLVYDGSDFISVNYLYKYIDNNPDGIFNFYSGDNNVISPYVEWNDTYGANPNHNLFIVRGVLRKNLISCSVILFTDTDNVDTSIDADGVAIDLGTFFRDKFNYPFDMLWYQPSVGIIAGEDKGTFTYSSQAIGTLVWAYNGVNANKLKNDGFRKIWGVDTNISTVTNNIKLYYNFTAYIKDV